MQAGKKITSTCNKHHKESHDFFSTATLSGISLEISRQQTVPGCTQHTITFRILKHSQKCLLQHLSQNNELPYSDQLTM